jgi:lysyl-tRNA synthetase, class II
VRVVDESGHVLRVGRSRLNPCLTRLPDDRTTVSWMVRLERHPSGPRVFVLGRRIHDFYLGFALGVAAAVVGALGHDRFGIGLAVVGVWLVVKDWRDLFPALRDTASWRLWIHRVPSPLRERRRFERLPQLAATAALVGGAVNLASALTPNVAWRGHLLLQVEPVEFVPLFHTLAVPASVALIVCAFYLGRRRRRAFHAALILLLALSGLDLLKGFDFEEAALSLIAAGLLWAGRGAFYVRHGRPNPRVLFRTLVGAAAVVALVAGFVALVAHVDSPRLLARETTDLLLWRHGPIAFGDEVVWLPFAAGAVALGGLLALAYLVFRPLAPRYETCRRDRRLAADLVRAHGRDTLAFFKLRRDTQYLFSSDRRAFAGYRIEGNVLLLSGDPVGDPASLPLLLCETCVFAERHGLRLGAMGVSAETLPLFRAGGLRALYIGDEAIVETGRFSLEGRVIRKVRQSVSRLEAAGYSVSAHDLARFDNATRAELDAVTSRWLDGAPERGFSMAMDSLDPGHQPDSVVVLTRDAFGAVRGFLHFVPSYGRSAMSLSFMRRDRDTPNGLTEFLVVKAIELLGERGIEELSLNFAAFARLIRAQGIAARVLSVGDRFFQIERLYRFNAKFDPRWEPRYLVFDGAFLRVGLAAMVAEGQLPRLSLARS